jgi:hypothetical protein
MTLTETKQYIANCCSSKRCSIEERDGAIVVKAYRDAFTIQATIAYEAHEISFEAYQPEKVLILKDWHDFYGANEVEDFKDDLSRIAEALADKDIRLWPAENPIRVEFLDEEWEYLFG